MQSSSANKIVLSIVNEAIPNDFGTFALHFNKFPFCFYGLQKWYLHKIALKLLINNLFNNNIK